MTVTCQKARIKSKADLKAGLKFEFKTLKGLCSLPLAFLILNLARLPLQNKLACEHIEWGYVLLSLDNGCQG